MTADRTDPQRNLIQLESQMRLLIQIRNERKRAAEIASKRADVEFDRDAIPLARNINRLREQIEDENVDEAADKAVAAREHRPKHVTHDPDWSEEEITHFYELQRR